MHTEEEARKKWCPFARQSDDTHSYNRWGRYGDGLIHCIASDCIAWRWRHTGSIVRNTETGKERPVTTGHSYRSDNEVKVGSLYSSTHGYCGLSGAPHDNTD